MTTEKWTLEDGRRVEKRVTEIHIPEKMESEKVVELHMEDERPLKLKQRMVEKTKPFVYEKRTETIDENGNVVDVKIESVEPKVNFQFVDHIVTDVAAVCNKGACNKGACNKGACDKGACNKGLTKEEIVEAVKESMNFNNLTACNKLKSKGIVEEIETNIQSENSTSMLDKILVGVIAIQLVGLAYLFFGM